MPITLTARTIKALRADPLARIFAETLPALQALLEKYLRDTLSVHITVTFGNSDTLAAYGLDRDVVGIFFVATENSVFDEKTQSLNEWIELSDHGFEVIINVPEHLSTIHSQATDEEIISIYSTLPHEIIHAINYANQSDGRTPLDIYESEGQSGLGTITDGLIAAFGSIEAEEQIVEHRGIVEAKALLTSDLIYEIRHL